MAPKALAGDTAMVTAHGIDSASDEIRTAAGNLADLNGDTATVTINLINNAGSVLGGVAN